MYCLRSYLPLLLLPLPLSLSPLHLVLLLVLTYILNRPCIYCSFLLVILFASSCHWSNRCFVDFHQHEETGSIASWFVPRLYTSRSSEMAEQMNRTFEVGGFLVDVVRSTVRGIAHAATDSVSGFLNEACQSLPEHVTGPSPPTSEVGTGVHWLRQLLGRNEWTLPCVGVKVVL